MSVGEDCVLSLVLAAMDGKPFTFLPSPDRAFASIQVGGYLLPRFQGFLRSISLWQLETPRKTIPETMLPGSALLYASEKPSG